MSSSSKDETSWVRKIEIIEPGRARIEVVTPKGEIAVITMSTQPLPPKIHMGGQL